MSYKQTASNVHECYSHCQRQNGWSVCWTESSSAKQLALPQMTKFIMCVTTFIKLLMQMFLRRKSYFISWVKCRLTEPESCGLWVPSEWNPEVEKKTLKRKRCSSLVQPLSSYRATTTTAAAAAVSGTPAANLPPLGEESGIHCSSDTRASCWQQLLKLQFFLFSITAVCECLRFCMYHLKPTKLASPRHLTKFCIWCWAVELPIWDPQN